MYYAVVCLCLAAGALAAPAAPDVVPLEKQQPTVIPIVSQSDELEPNGTYKFSYETGNGIKREETSYDKVIPKARGKTAGADSNEGGESDSDEIHVQQGSYSYTAPDGTLISVRYIADENGFQPIGDHIPRAPSPSFGSGSAEKSGRALNVADNAEAGSSPAVAARSAIEPVAAKAAPVPLTAAAPEPEKSAESAEATSSTASAESESSTKAAESEASTTEGTSKSEPSTTEAATEASTTVAEKAPEVPAEPSTTAAASTPEEPSTAAPNAEEASTTEAANASTPAA